MGGLGVFQDLLLSLPAGAEEVSRRSSRFLADYTIERSATRQMVPFSSLKIDPPDGLTGLE